MFYLKFISVRFTNRHNFAHVDLVECGQMRALALRPNEILSYAFPQRRKRCACLRQFHHLIGVLRRAIFRAITCRSSFAEKCSECILLGNTTIWSGTRNVA